MRAIHSVAGLPRAGSTLLCQILNSNPKFHVTPTSGVLDMLKTMRSNFSSNMTFRAQNRLEIYENFRQGLKGFLEGFFYDSEVVFDKNRAWTTNLTLLDNVLENKDSKVIWLYRDPVEIVSSIEAQYQKTYLLENMDETASPGAFMTLERRISTYTSPEGLISFPVEALKDALEMGYGHRILFVKYYELTNNPKETLARIRGKYSGNLKTPDSELTLDYTSLATEAKDEKTKLIEELIGAEGRLTRLKPEKVMEREALMSENLNKQLKFRAFPRPLYVI